MDTLKNLIGAFLTDSPEEAVRIMGRYQPVEVVELLKTFSRQELSLVFAHVLPVTGAAYLDMLDPGEASAVLEPLPDDVVLELLRPMKEEARQRLLDNFPQNLVKFFIRQLEFPEGTAGSVMNTFSVVLTEELTVDEALHRVRKVHDDPAFYPYVVDHRQHLVGRLTVRALMLADPEQTLGEIMQRDVARIPAKAAIRSQIPIAVSKSFQSLPVVDDDGVLLGVVTPDRLSRLQTVTPGLDFPVAAANILTTLSTAYWEVLATLISQTAAMLADRPGSQN